MILYSNIFALIGGGLLSLVAILYISLIVKDKIQPVLSTWLMLAVVIGLSFLSYWFAGQKSLVGNILNLIDVFYATIVVVLLLRKSKQLRFRFSKLELLCLGLSGIILVFWMVSNNAFLSNLFLQIILSIAYIPTIYILYKAKVSTESLLAWSINTIATTFGLLAAISQGNYLGSVYAGRGLFFVSLLTILIIRIKTRNYQGLTELAS